MEASHGTVGRHIEALEATYGVQLFRRTRSGLELTSAGRSLVPIAEQAETLFHGARRRMQGLDREETGVVRFSMTGVMAYEIVAPILVKFFEAYPGIDVEMRVTDRMEDINRLETDVSMRFADEITDDVTARRLYPMALGYYASREYLEKHMDKAGSDGEGLHWIGWDKVDRTPGWRSRTPLSKATAHHATTDHVLQVSLARKGFGIVNTSIYFERVFPELVLVPGTTPALSRSLWILLHSELRRTTRVRRFVDFLAKEMAALRPLIQGPYS